MPQLSQHKRSKIQVLAEDGLTNQQIAAEVGTSIATVKVWKHRNSTHDAPRSGRTSKLTSNTLKSIRKMAIKIPPPSQRYIAQQVGVSPRTVGRGLKVLDLHYRLRPTGPPLSDDDRRRRYAYAKAEKERDWSRVVFLDEAVIRQGVPSHPSQRGIYLLPGETADHYPVTAYSASFNVCGAIWKGGRTPLHVFKESMTKEVFIHILKTTIIPAIKKHFKNTHWTLVMDGNRAHVAADTVKYLKKRGIDFVTRDQWPPRSPDLNASENCWFMLKYLIDKEGPVPSDAFENHIHTSWANIPENDINETIDSMPRRIQHVIATRGELYHE